MNKTQIILLAALATTIITSVFLFMRKNDLENIKDSFDYDSQLAENLSGYSMAAYCRASKIISWDCGYACSKNPDALQDVYVMKNKTMNAGGYLGYSPAHDAILIIFRGTLPWLVKNWISDLDTVKVNYPLCQDGCKVHLGFYNAFKELQYQIQTQFDLLKQKYPNAKVYITGHSLGAAMATHAVPYVYELNGRKPIDAFYVYGSPRVGDENYSLWFENQKFSVEKGRISHNADVVPHLPPDYAPFKFTHIHQEVFYKNFKQPFVQCSDPESLSCADGVKLPVSITDHLSYFGWDWAVDIVACQ